MFFSVVGVKVGVVRVGIPHVKPSILEHCERYDIKFTFENLFTNNRKHL